MASVYRALDPNLRRTVAVKLIHSHLAQQPEFVQRFENEAAAVARLRHPNIVPVYDFSNERGVYYMVMAYLTGGSLQERLKALKETDMRLPLAETIRIMITICEAVASAHQQGIIHRDLKPANVLFDEQGNPHLTDFGIARLVGAQQTVTVVGTPAYMSPEQIKGDPNLDQRCDIYSLGIMLYEMASGEPPFEGSLGTLMFKHMQEPVPDIRLVNSQVPPALVAIIEKALSKSPQHRFQSATEMATALRKVSQQGRTVPVRQGDDRTQRNPPPPPPSSLPKRPWWLWLVAFVLVAAIAIGGIAFSGILDATDVEFTGAISLAFTVMAYVLGGAAAFALLAVAFMLVRTGLGTLKGKID
jgi:serine/threonine protein kinase